MLRGIVKTLLLFNILISMVHAELLILVKDKSTGLLRAMTDEETLQYQNKISDVLLKYQWPMCIQSDLTPAEVAEYLAPGKPYAQEQFIHKKLQEVVSPAEIDLQVMFVPDSLYELFCIAEKSNERFNAQYQEAQRLGNMHVKMQDNRIRPQDLLEHDVDVVKQKLKDSFVEVNSVFAKKQGGLSAWSVVNNSMVEFMFKQYPELCHTSNGLVLSNEFEAKTETVKVQLCDIIGKNDRLDSGRANGEALWAIGFESKTHIISTVMGLEYEARLLNKALLLRGTSVINKSTDRKHLQQEEKLILAGSTQTGDNFRSTLIGDSAGTYSISYANSLFAGYYHDQGGCAYNYLNGRGTGFSISAHNMRKRDEMVGYGLLIDQQAYMHDGCRGLFYIPSLSPLTSLFEIGQYCHPRSRVAVADKSTVGKVEGLIRSNGQGLVDPADIIIFQGDATKHEERFSTFLVKNGRLINVTDDLSMKSEAKDNFTKILDSQKTVSKSYQKIRVFGQKILRRLVRVGMQRIPGFSEKKLYDILQNGCTEKEYEQLNDILLEMPFVFSAKKLVVMSNQELYATLIGDRLGLLLDEIRTSGLGNIQIDILLHDIAMVSIAKKTLTNEQVDQLITMLYESLKDHFADHSLKRNVITIIYHLVKVELIQPTDIDRIFSLILRSFDIDVSSSKVIDILIDKHLLNKVQLDELLLVARQKLQNEINKLWFPISVNKKKLGEKLIKTISLEVRANEIASTQLTFFNSYILPQTGSNKITYAEFIDMQIQHYQQQGDVELNKYLIPLLEKEKDSLNRLRVDKSVHYSSGGLSATSKKLMRLVQPSSEEIALRSQQIEKFNRLMAEQQQESFAKSRFQQHPELEMHQMLMHDQAQLMKHVDATALFVAAKRSIRQSLPKLPRMIR